MFDPRRASTQVELAGLQVRVERRPDAAPIRSDPRLSFLVPAPGSAEPEDRREARGPGPSVVVEELEVDARRARGRPSAASDPRQTDAVRGVHRARGAGAHRRVLDPRGDRAPEPSTARRPVEDRGPDLGGELRPHDVDFKNGTVRLRLGKGLKPRTTVPMANLSSKQMRFGGALAPAGSPSRRQAPRWADGDCSGCADKTNSYTSGNGRYLGRHHHPDHDFRSIFRTSAPPRKKRDADRLVPPVHVKPTGPRCPAV